MSAVAEQTYKAYYNGNKDWFINTPKDEFLRIGADNLSCLKQNKPLSDWCGTTTNLRNAPTKKVILQIKERPLFVESDPTHQEEANIQFPSLVAEWKESIRVISDWNLMILHPNYQRIIGLGPDVIPLILEELKLNGGHWFWALQALTGENPIADEDAGRVKKMTEAWLAWGRDKGYI